MSRRKGELSPARIDQGWPYQIAVADTEMRAKPFEEWRASQERLKACKRGHTIYFEGEFWHVVCFADAHAALEFKKEWNGVNFDPADRGRGTRWAVWKRPYAEPPLGGWRRR